MQMTGSKSTFLSNFNGKLIVVYEVVLTFYNVALTELFIH